MSHNTGDILIELQRRGNRASNLLLPLLLLQLAQEILQTCNLLTKSKALCADAGEEIAQPLEDAI